MIKFYNELLQGSQEWHNARNGVITASNMGKVLLKSKKIGEYAYQLAAERITGRTDYVFETSAMKRGKRDEILARDLYNEKYGNAAECGFITRTTEGLVLGYSPDGLVGEIGAIEVKSKGQKDHVKILSTGEVPEEHYPQIMCGIYVANLEWVDFISYCSGLPMFVKRVYRDEEYIALMVKQCEVFNDAVGDIVQTFKSESACFEPTEYVDFYDDGLEF